MSPFGNLWPAIAYEIRFRWWQKTRRAYGKYADDGPESRIYFAFNHLQRIK